MVNLFEMKSFVRGRTIKRAGLMLASLMLGALLAGCGQTADASDAKGAEAKSSESVQTEKIQVIATLFPQYDFAKAIGKEHVEVRLLMPPGTESHSYEPTPKDLVDIENADVFIYTSLAMEPWVEKLLTQIGPGTLVVDASKGVTMLSAEALGLEAHEEEGAGEADHEHEGVDPHIWLDPINAGIMAQNVADALIQVMPEQQKTFTVSVAQYQDELLALDTEINNTLSQYPDRSIIFAGHYAFGYFSKRYGLDYHSPYEGFSPDSEPSPQKIAQMVDLMRSENQQVVYYEELIDPKIARIIAGETNAEMVMLHAAHNVSKDDLSSQITYIQIMKANLKKLEEGLKTHE